MMRIFRYFFIITIGIIWQSHIAFAENKNVSTKESKTLQTLDQELEEHEKNLQILSQKKQEINQILEETKGKLITVTQEIDENEKQLSELNTRISGLELKKSVLEDKFKADKMSISRLILALERIRRTPPEAMIARPDSPYETAQSAMLMGDIIPALNRHAKALKKNMETIEAVSNDLNQEKESAEVVSKKLQSQQKDLEKLIDQRKNLYAKTDKDLKAREISIEKISLQAQNIKELVKKLQIEEENERTRKQKEAEALALEEKLKPPKIIKPFYKTGEQLPVSGIILTRYKEKDDLGALSNGLTIEARSGAIVVAPMSGKIQFAGAFKRYGNLIIIEHENGYHSLVAGLEKIDTVVGQSVTVGEPIGKMPQKTLQSHSKLYYELRKNGNPVNPSEKFADLG